MNFARAATASPAMSVATERSRDTDTAGPSIAVNYAQVFDDVDWTAVDLLDLEETWRTELELIEKENVQALMDSSSKAQLVLPAVHKAIEEVSRLSTVYDEYADALKITGLEIQQIELLNRGLETQTRNQTALLAKVREIISMVALPDGVLDVLQTMPLDASSAIPKIERAAKELYHLLSVKFEGGIQDIKAISDRLRYYNEQHAAFARRLVHFLSTSLADIAAKTVASGSRSILSTATGAVSLPKHDELLVFLTAYHPLILLCKAQCPREHYDICSAYQSALGTILTKDLARLFDSIKTSHLIRRPATDPPSVFANAALKNTAFSLNVGRTPAASAKDFGALRLLRREDLPFLGDGEFVYPDQAMQFIILTVATNISAQYKMAAQMLFGQSSSSDLQADLRVAKKLDAIMGSIYASLGERLPAFVDQCIKLDESCAIDLLGVLDARIGQVNQLLPIFGKILEAIEHKVLSYAEFFLESQIETIEATHYSARKRAGIFGYVETFPRFIARIETVLATCGVSSATAISRELVNRYYEKIGQVIFDSFKTLAAEADDGDEKGHINASVMTIENSHHLFNQLREMAVAPLEPIVRSSRVFYEQSLATYATLSIYRVLARYAEYFEALANLLKTTAPEEVAFTSAYSKASVKRMLAAFPLKEMKRAIDLLRQRALKHFSDQKELLGVVWQAVQDEFIRRQTAMIDGLAKVFPGATDVAPPYALDNLISYFSEVTLRRN